MGEKRIDERELKLTAAIYAARPGVLEHLRKTGKLPSVIPTPGGEIQMKILIRNRGTDIQLTPNEQLVYDTIVRENRLPGGSVRLVDRER